MPESKFGRILFSLCMVIVMVYGMVCYNVVVNTHVFDNSVFLNALHELPIMVPIAFILEVFLVERFALHKASQLVDVKNGVPFHFVIAMSVVTVACMCPLMSCAATLLFKREAVAAHGFLGTWLLTTALNFPMALCSQSSPCKPSPPLTPGKLQKNLTIVFPFTRMSFKWKIKYQKSGGGSSFFNLPVYFEIHPY